MNSRGHDVIIALNAGFPDTIERLKMLFDGLLPRENLFVWSALSNSEELLPQNVGRRFASERIKEASFNTLHPDIVHTTSLFEGLGDNSIASIPASSDHINAVTLYDLIPYLRADRYLENEKVEDWYRRRILQLQYSDIALAISESSRREGIDALGMLERTTVNISCAADDRFHVMDISPSLEDNTRQKYGLTKPFVMYTGGIDFRKNIEGLIEAYAMLLADVRSAHQLAIVCRVSDADCERLKALAAQCGLAEEDLVLTGFVSDEDLAILYNLCHLFIFPSIHEGFGLPALEAMSCGAAVIGSNCTSIPEVIGRPDALFDPTSTQSIASKLAETLQNPSFLADLRVTGVERSKLFSWERSAEVTWDVFERACRERDLRKRPVELPAYFPIL